MHTVDSEIKIPVTFTFPSDNRKHSSVQISGTFDKWQVRHPLVFDPLHNKWAATLKIRKGMHFYKYIVDGAWNINKNEKTIIDDVGNTNNFINL